jgi:hypothetical protein
MDSLAASSRGGVSIEEKGLFFVGGAHYVPPIGVRDNTAEISGWLFTSAAPPSSAEAPALSPILQTQDSRHKVLADARCRLFYFP